jgi:hypothetical protein
MRQIIQRLGVKKEVGATLVVALQLVTITGNPSRPRHFKILSWRQDRRL